MGFGEENRWRLSFPGSAGVIKFKHTLKYVKKINNVNLPPFIGNRAIKKLLHFTVSETENLQQFLFYVLTYFV